MKKILLIGSIGFFTAFNSYSQERGNVSLSKADAFVKSGALIQKEFIEVGNTSSLKVKILILTDLNSSAKASAVRLESETNSSGLNIGSVDADELEGMIKSLKQIQGSRLNTSPTSYTEVSFTSRDGLEAGCYFDEEKRKWTPFMKFPNYDSKSVVIMKTEQMTELLNLLESARSKMVLNKVYSYSKDISK